MSAVDAATGTAAIPGRYAPPDGGVLPPHMPGCMVCGPAAVHGYQLRSIRRGDKVVADFTFTAAHEGGPGLAHGGAVAAVCDDILGHVLTLVGIPAVTRRLEMDFLAPVVIGESHRVIARLTGHGGRKLWMEAEGTHDGVVRFRARALFVQVGLRHFLAGLTPEERDRAEAYLAEHDPDAVNAP